MTQTSVHTHDAVSDLAFEDGVPYGYFDEARRDDPVRWIEEEGGPGYWSVTRYADVVAVTRNFQVFSSEVGGTIREDIAPEDLAARKTLIDTDPPVHTSMRRLLSPRFTPGSVHKEWVGFVEELVEETLGTAFSRSRFDFVEDVAAVVPMIVLGELLGVPVEDRAYLKSLGDEMIASSDPDHAPRTAESPERVKENSGFPFSSPAGRDMWKYADALRDKRRDNLGHDVFSLLMTGNFNGRKLTERELDNFFSLLVVAGNETTRMALSHGVLAFAQHPEQFRRLKDDPTLLNTAVEEILRWATPIHHFRRTALTDTVIGETAVKAGDKVLIWYASANRDENVFPDPYSFDIGRKPNPHIAFGGGGPHVCMGNSLARLELQIVFRELARRVETIELDGPVDRLRSNLTHGIKSLPVHFTYA
ncbi:cytochrome P450 [Arthrobacter livingstonensis]|uniref:Cytochrome P450 n=1 Tax=Arthrobacter livingstonensis TaxID=670078 RepID=A0A2V5L888_9MICC|nr:cytochrome P450 [Arthrobacter livingstonensis]PYI67649.1 cytochrome P450 [Arthrobacter livingstonensis]